MRVRAGRSISKSGSETMHLPSSARWGKLQSNPTAWRVLHTWKRGFKSGKVLRRHLLWGGMSWGTPRTSFLACWVLVNPSFSSPATIDYNTWNVYALQWMNQQSCKYANLHCVILFSVEHNWQNAIAATCPWNRALLQTNRCTQLRTASMTAN